MNASAEQHAEVPVDCLTESKGRRTLSKEQSRQPAAADAPNSDFFPARALALFPEERHLLDLILHESLELQYSLRQPATSLPFSPRDLLCLIVFCFTAGLCGSEQISDFIRERSGISLKWEAIREFRKIHGAFIQQVFAAVLARPEGFGVIREASSEARRCFEQALFSDFMSSGD